MVEQHFCKVPVVGSSPTMTSRINNEYQATQKADPQRSCVEAFSFLV